MNLLVKYFVRRNVTDTPPTRDLDNIFIEIVKQLHSNKAYDLSIIKKYLLDTTRIATDLTFQEKLEGSIYDDNTSATRFILCKLEEENNKTKETYIDLWARDEKGKFIWTIEHIFPQGDNIPQVWIEMMADGDLKFAESIKNEYVHQLGNLTISGYNQKLGNMSFEKKRDRTDDKGSYVGYKNGLYLNEKLKDEDSWSVKKIKSRGENLILQIMEYYKILLK